ncbi:MAG: orotidine-5'-phosphate decarboxylase [Lachnospiraceae bacterium]
MKNISDKLNEKIISLRAPILVGLDPVLERIPEFIKQPFLTAENEYEAVSKIILRFNQLIIDEIEGIVPAVKPQIAFYEQYGSYGVKAFEDTVQYAKSKGFIVVEDGKRNDIGSTVQAYANGHLGKVELLSGEKESLDVDFLTVSPFLGWDGIEPFIDVCKESNKGLFILVKTSNKSSGEIQDCSNSEGISLSTQLAERIAKENEVYLGESGYSPIGAVVGATYPEEAADLRKIMKQSIFLVPGFGAQGGSAADIVPCFNEDGLGAVVNSSRGIIYSYLDVVDSKSCTEEMFKKSIKEAALLMKNNIYMALKGAYPEMLY